MKRCPVCQQTYVGSMSYCRLDGTALVGSSSSPSETNETLKLPSHESGAAANPSAYTARLPRRARSVKSKVIDSLAVFPLTNASDDPQMEYLADGITESIINTLSQLPKLRVVPRSTVFRYKASDVVPETVGFLLGVRAVLTGRVLRIGDSLVVTAELIDIDHQSQVWGEQYRRKLTDIFDLQEEISKEISEKLRLRLTGEEKRKLSKRYTQNAEAYHCYLKGRYYINKRTTEWIKKGIEDFQRAIDLDPNFAMAYAGLADAYAFLGSSTGERPPVEFYPMAHAAARKALELDDTLAEAHSTLGFFYMMYEWDFKKAQREFKRAIALNPNYATAHDGYSFYFKATGQHQKAIRECRRAQQDDWLSLFAPVSTAWAYYFARQYENAVKENRRALEMDSRFVFGYWNLGLSLARLGRIEEAIDALERAVKYSGDGLTFKAHLGYVYGLGGRRTLAKRILSELKKHSKEKYVPAYYFAIIHMGLEELDKVFEWLERAREERSGFLAFINVEPMFDHLHKDPRFIDFARRISPSM